MSFGMLVKVLLSGVKPKNTMWLGCSLGVHASSSTSRRAPPPINQNAAKTLKRRMCLTDREQRTPAITRTTAGAYEEFESMQNVSCSGGRS